MSSGKGDNVPDSTDALAELPRDLREISESLDISLAPIIKMMNDRQLILINYAHFIRTVLFSLA
jgi:hypothetical protein